MRRDGCEIDPADGSVARRVETRYRPEGLATAGDHLWLSACRERPATTCVLDRATLSLVGGELTRIDPGPFG